ncbi:hypothetical protein ACO0QE_004781 [Hanseniaspora vineae]
MGLNSNTKTTSEPGLNPVLSPPVSILTNGSSNSRKGNHSTAGHEMSQASQTFNGDMVAHTPSLKETALPHKNANASTPELQNRSTSNSSTTSHNNIYSKFVRQTSENSLYGAKTNGKPLQESNSHLKVATTARQQPGMNKAAETNSILETNAYSGSVTPAASLNASMDLKTPGSAVQFHIEEGPAKRLPHQHRGSLTARTATQQQQQPYSAAFNKQVPVFNIGSSSTSERNVSQTESDADGINGAVSSKSRNGVSGVNSTSGGAQPVKNPSGMTSFPNNTRSSNTSLNTSFSDMGIHPTKSQAGSSKAPSRNNSIHEKSSILSNSSVISPAESRKSSAVPMPGDFMEIDSPVVEKFPGSPKNETLSSQKLVETPVTATSETKSLVKKSITEYFPKEDDNKLHILIGATGSVATIKIPLIVNKLLKHYTPDKCSIQVILTNSSKHFLKGSKISSLVKVWTDEDLDSNINFKFGEPILQIELRRWADIFVIAPLSANTLAKISNGISDNLLTTVIRGWPISSTPLYVAPAMNTFMYIHPITKKHLALLQEDLPFVEILRPVEKVLVCGDIGMGGMREWNDIVKIVIDKLDSMKREHEDDSVIDEEDEEEDEEEEEDEDDEDKQANMSFLGFGGGQPQLSSTQKIQAAEAELDLITDMFNKLVDNCHQKCINKQYSEGGLDKTESNCLDRCVAKYFETNVKVGENMQQFGQSFQPGRQ